MAFPDQHHLQVINQVTELLSDGDRRKLLYLCGCLESDNSGVRVKEILKCKMTRHDDPDLLLRELMLSLQRCDILRKVCKTSRAEVERTLTGRQALPKFRVLMANISEEMDSEDLNRMIFLLSTTLTREKTEKAKSFLDVIIELEKLGMVSPESVDFVQKCLVNIERVDLAKKVAAYKMPVGASQQQSPQLQRPMITGPLTSSSSYHLLQRTRQIQPIHRAAENILAPVYREQSCQSQPDWYKFNTNPRGVCVIIDCVGNDGDMLEETFKALHFKVVLHKWLSMDDTLSALRETFRRRESFEGDCFVCCIISRGRENHLLGTDSYSVGLHLDNVRHLFNADACPMLAGKPKLFFIQRYSVPEFQPHARMNHRDEDLETDGCDGQARCNFIPRDADVFWSHCWTDEGQLEQRNHSSTYLRALTRALQNGQRRRTHLVDLHTEVNGAVFEHNKKNPGAKYHIDVKHTLRKDLYLQ